MIPITAALGLASGLALFAAHEPPQQGVDRLVPPAPVNSFIHDGGSVLSAADITTLDSKIREIQSTGRGDIGVAILRDLADFPAFEVGTAIYRHWRIGSVDSIGSVRRDLGVLLLIVPKELSPNKQGECWITTGTGAEGMITDAVSGRICRDAIVPLLRDRDYAGAVGAGIEAIAAVLGAGVPAGAMPAAASERNTEPLGMVGSVVAGLFAMAGGATAWRMRRRRRARPCPNGHGPMHRLDESADDAALEAGQGLEESLHSVDYDVWVCDVCNARLILRYKRWLTPYSQCPTCAFWTVRSQSRTVSTATSSSEGLEETTRLCKSCKFTDTQRHSTPRLSAASSSSSGGSASSGGGSSFGGSGSSSGGGGGSSY